MQDCPESDEALVALIEAELSDLDAVKAAEMSRLGALDEAQAALGHHPNHHAYAHGGLVAVREMGAAHILAHAGFYRLAHGEAMARLAAAREDGGDDCLITALRIVCESDPLLEVAGLDWLGKQGLLKRGAVDRFWLRRPLLGLGQPARLHGLEARHLQGHRGLYTLDSAALAARVGAVAAGPDDSFGDRLLAVVEAGGAALAALGAAAIEQDARDRYEADCVRFADHQRRRGGRRWRWKPALSRQGHLAVTTSHVRDVPLPAERTRGHAANWLEDHGANPRFREDPR